MGLSRLLLIFLLPLFLLGNSSQGGSEWGSQGRFGAVAAAGPTIDEDFSVDNFVDIENSISVGGGVGTNGSGWALNSAYVNTSVGDNDNWAEITAEFDAAWSGGGVVIRCNGTTGYLMVLQQTTANQVGFYKFNGTTETALTYFTWTSKTLTAGNSYTLKAQVVGGTFSAWIDGDAADSTIADATYATGDMVGVAIRAGNSAGGAVWVDDLTGDGV